MSKVPKNKKRLSRDDWLTCAIDVLSKQGGARLNIAPLCQKLGVTKGSFYAHFKSQADFVSQLIGYWEQAFTQTVVVKINKLEEQTAKQRLLAVMRLIHSKRLASYDVAFRTWAAQDLRVAEGVNEVDRLRFDYIRMLFKEMGFSGIELEVRTRLFVVYHSADPGLISSHSGPVTDEYIKTRHAILTN